MTTPGHNSDLTAAEKSEIARLTREIKKMEDDRSAIGAKINSHRKQIKAFHIDLDAWRASKRRQEMDPDDRAEFDRSAAICNAALGVPMQAELFGDVDDDDDDDDGDEGESADAKKPEPMFN